MALKDLKITSYKDNISELPDTPSSSGITATQLKAIFDGRTDKEIKEAINGIIEILSSVNGASNVSATPVKVDGADTVQGILDELEQNKIDKTAEADYMRISAYDTDNDGVVDNAMALAGQPIEYFETKGEADDRYNEIVEHLEETDLNHNSLKTDYESFKETATTDIANRVEKEEGKGLSKNDLTDELKGSYDDAVSLKHWHDNKSALDTIPSGGVVSTLGADDTTIPTSKAVAQAISFAGGGDMLKTTYDKNNNGIVDNSEALEGKTLTQVVGMAVESAKQNVSASDVGAYTISQTDEVIGNTLAIAKAYADERITEEVDALNKSITKLEEKISESSSSSLEDCLTRFNADGSITQIFSDRTSTTTFNEDGSITEQIVSTDGKVITKTTTFNEDGSISEVVS